MIRRSVLAQSIHELWGSGKTLDKLHQSVQERTSQTWGRFKSTSFKFVIDSFQGTCPDSRKLSIINSFRYLPFDGPISMSRPDNVFTVFELWPFNSVPLGIENPDMVHLGRLVASSSRDVILTFDLKKRGYISTTSMDSELSLVTANIALAAPGKLFYDPFVGTGSFPIACAHFGAVGWGSDIDGRSIRGDGGRKSLRGNFEQYGLSRCLGDIFAADLTHTPIRIGSRMWDGIVCDPPYGVREGLRVLGVRDPEKTPWVIEHGIKKSGYVLSVPHPYFPFGQALETCRVSDTQKDFPTMCHQKNLIVSWPCSTTSSSSRHKPSWITDGFPFGCQPPTTKITGSRYPRTHASRSWSYASKSSTNVRPSCALPQV